MRANLSFGSWTAIRDFGWKSRARGETGYSIRLGCGSWEGTMPAYSTDNDSIPRDRLGRPMRDLRISIIDRCNLRCTYCMPKEEFGESYKFMPRSELLSFEEIARLARIFQKLGVVKIRLTGGEPLLRHSIQTLVQMLSGIGGIQDIALTTNGILLPKLAQAIRDAGLGRLTVSLDTLNPGLAGAINGTGVPPEKILAGIEAARKAGFTQIKINAVILRGVNEDSALGLAEHFRGSGCILRFIEYMDAGNVNAWDSSEVIMSRDVHDQIHAKFPLRPLDENYPGEVARRYAYEDGAGEVGFISSVSEPFCGGCTRARLSADGKLYMCLFASRGVDLREPLRAGASDSELEALLVDAWSGREDQYSELRAGGASDSEAERKIEMYQIGG